jgi:polysaccharide biosynthesis protein PslH
MHPPFTDPHSPRVLWLAREIPYPLDSGDRMYSALLVRALADAGARVTFVGLTRPDGTPPPDDGTIQWKEIPGGRPGKLRALLSPMPLVAATYSTPAYRRELAQLLQGEWDAVVVDQYGMCWVVPEVKKMARPPVLVHMSHDHETSVTASLYRNMKGAFLKRLVLWQNHLKTHRYEGELARQMDLITAITPGDAALFQQDAPGVRTLVLSPGYDGDVVTERRLNASIPRRVVMAGSYHWVAKQENLRQFVAAADAIFAERGIELHVIGSMPPALAQELAAARSVHLHGFVESLAPYFAAARMAVVPEVIGGGFKLKFLNYIFSRLPVATLREAAAGLPTEAVSAMLCADSLDELVASIVDAMDDFDRLNTMQENAFAAANNLFAWRDRGSDLLRAIESMRTPSPLEVGATS